MALKITRTMPPVEGVALSNTATLRLPIGLTYHKVFLEIGNVVAGPGPTLAEIDAIRVTVNGRRLINYVTGGGQSGGLQIDQMNTFDGMAAVLAAGNLAFVTIDFDRFNMRTRAAEEITALGTGFPNDPTPITTATVEIDIGAAALTPTIRAWALQSTPQPLGVMKKVLAFNFAPAGAGDFEINDLPKGDLINRIFFRHSANLINNVRVERDNFIVFDRPALLNTTEQGNGIRTPSALLYVFDPTEAGNGAEGLVTESVNDLRFILDLSGAMSLLATVEYIGGILT